MSHNEKNWFVTERNRKWSERERQREGRFFNWIQTMGKSKRSTHFLWPLRFAQYASYSKVKITHTQNAIFMNEKCFSVIISRVVPWMESVERKKKNNRRHLHISDISYRAPFRWVRLDIGSVLNTNMYILCIIHINFVFLFSLIQLFVEFFCLRWFFCLLSSSSPLRSLFLSI